MQQKGLIHDLIIFLKGMAMGAADVVPGVSGGTIAFISGIYEELLGAISAFNLGTVKLLFTGRFKEVWRAVNGRFLTALLLGIFVSIISLAKILSFLLEEKPILVWSFFFGLVLASILYIGKQITKWNISTGAFVIVAALIAYYITTLQPMVTEETSLLYLFLSGALAICAMILPGISGAFILVLLGAYKPVLEAIHDRDFRIIVTLAFGAVVGLLTFSKILKWLFNNFKNSILAILTGFILGSLNKIWPWKKVLESVVIEDKIVVLKEHSISPTIYEGEPQLLGATVLALFGFAIILLLEKLAKK